MLSAPSRIPTQNRVSRPSGSPSASLNLCRLNLCRLNLVARHNASLPCRGPRQVLQGLNFFHRPQLRAAGPWVAIAFLVRCRHRLFRKLPVVALLHSLAEGIFYDAVFERVKTDDHHASPWFHDPGRAFQQRPQIVQFTVYEDSKSLKGPGRRMNPPLFRIHWPGRG